MSRCSMSLIISQLLSSLVQILALKSEVNKADILDCFPFSEGRYKIHFCKEWQGVLPQDHEAVGNSQTVSAWDQTGPKPSQAAEFLPFSEPRVPLHWGRDSVLEKCRLKRDAETAPGRQSP